MSKAFENDVCYRTQRLSDTRKGLKRRPKESVECESSFFVETVRDVQRLKIFKERSLYADGKLEG